MVFAAAVGDIWDQLAEAGVMPCSFTALDNVRIEAGLLFYGYDMTNEHAPWKAGLGYPVSKTKSGYRGHQAVQATKNQEKVKIVCLVIVHSDMAAGGECLLADGIEIGVVNSPCYSHRLGKSLALALDPVNVRLINGLIDRWIRCNRLLQRRRDRLAMPECPLNR